MKTNNTPLYARLRNLFLVGAITFTNILHAQPSISSFSPESGPVGTTVTITGNNFSSTPGDNIVYFGAVKAQVLSASNSTITVTVPVGASYKPITVTTNQLTGYAARPFVLTFSNGGVPLSKVFAQKQDFDMDFRCIKGIVADLNGDGKPELLLLNYLYAIVDVFKNTTTESAFSLERLPNVITLGNPTGFDVGDIDGDGKLDLVVTSEYANKVSVYQNTSVGNSISFAPRKDFATSVKPTAVKVGDLDADGKPDLVVCNQGPSSITLFKNVTSGGVISFNTPIEYITGFYPYSVSISDLNDDQRPDLVVSNISSNTISIFKNSSSVGTISYETKVDFNTGTAPWTVATGDLNGDGKPDIAVTNSRSNSVSVFKNTSAGNISLDAKVDFSTGYSPSSLEIADLDGDGKPDLSFVNYFDSTVSILRNAATGSAIAFEDTLNLPVARYVAAATVGDLDMNGKPDLVTLNEAPQTVSILRNLGAEPTISGFAPTLAGPGASVVIKGTHFTNTNTVTFGGVPAASFNVINDTTIEAVIANGATGIVGVTTPVGTTGLAGFTFTNNLVISSFLPSSGPIGISVVINGANFSPVASENIVYFGTVRATVNAATTTSLSVTVPAGANFLPITVNRNGIITYSQKPFLVTFPGAAPVFSDNSLGGRSTRTAGTNPYSVAAADFDGDGKLDVVVVNSGSDNISIYQNASSRGHIGLGPRMDFSVGSNPQSFCMVDLDGDGKLDIAVVSRLSNMLSIFRNTSAFNSISFASRLDIPVYALPIGITSGDIDGDGKPDLVVANYDVADNTQPSVVSFFRNAGSVGNISFASRQDLVVSGSKPRTVLLGELNADGKPDLIFVSDMDYPIHVSRNLSTPGSIVFGGQQDYWSNASPMDIALGDLDGDGLPDVVVANANANDFAVFQNASSPTGIVLQSKQEFNGAGFPMHIVLSDMDGDGKPDVMMPGMTTDNFNIFKNLSPGLGSHFAFQSYSFSVTSPTGACAADLDGDGKPDVITTSFNENRISFARNTVGEPTVIPSGTNPVVGTVLNWLRMDSTVQTYNGSPYVQRHYDIEPEISQPGATATVTLYFTQEEFNNYNAHPAHGPNLPTGPTDAVGKANLRVIQFHGFSTSSLPGTYSGSGIEINPDDSKIVWNGNSQLWEVTFDVNGFSGFFVSTVGAGILPLKLLSFSGKAEDKNVLLTWTTSNEVNTSHFELERGIDGTNFSLVKKIPSKGGNLVNQYEFLDGNVMVNTPYYRLKMVDADGRFVYSKVVVVKRDVQNNSLNIFPNPAKKFVVIDHPIAGTHTEIKLIDMSGRVVKKVKVQSSSIQTRIDLNVMIKGIYKLVWTDGSQTFNSKLIVE